MPFGCGLSSLNRLMHRKESRTRAQRCLRYGNAADKLR